MKANEAAELREAIEWLESAGASGAIYAKNLNAFAAWGRAGYPNRFADWVCVEVARRLRNMLPAVPNG
jgi:hypothetical protein